MVDAGAENVARADHWKAVPFLTPHQRKKSAPDTIR